MNERVSLTVNGRAEWLRVEGAEPLVATLRRELGLSGVREACSLGVCGSCTVLVDGVAQSACLLLTALLDGAAITTVEGMAAEDGSLDPIQAAFARHNAFQCAFCTPGFLLATRALLAEEPDPAPDRVREALAGNLCRCGSYARIEAAVLDAAATLRRERAG